MNGAAVDLNEAQGRVLLNWQRASQDEIRSAWLAVRGRPDMDLAGFLVAQGRLDPATASQVRQQAGAGSEIRRPGASGVFMAPGAGPAMTPPMPPGVPMHASGSFAAPGHPGGLSSPMTSSASSYETSGSFHPGAATFGGSPSVATPPTPPSSLSGASSGYSSSASVSDQARSMADHREMPDRIGDYEIEEEISRGGMGAVYIAQSLKLKTRVALKTLLAGKMASKDLIQRFLIEAETTARLNHPNIVRVHDVGEEDGQYFLVMDYVEGGTLKDRLKDRGPLPPAEVAEYGRKMADALDYAHKRSILHRDIKPANILLRREDGEILVTDFGLAKDVSENKDGAGLTMSGAMLGTPQYMSPEQADGDAALIDRRTDVYAIGASMYELLTGEQPFTGETVTNILNAVMTKDPVAPRAIRPEIPVDLETIVLKSMEKQPADRYLTAGSLAKDLERFLNDEDIVAQPPSLLQRAGRWGRRHRGVLQASVAVAAALLISVVVFTLRSRQEAALRSRMRAVEPEARETADAAMVLERDKLRSEYREELARLRGDALGRLAEESVKRRTDPDHKLDGEDAISKRLAELGKAMADEAAQAKRLSAAWQESWKRSFADFEGVETPASEPLDASIKALTKDLKTRSLESEVTFIRSVQLERRRDLLGAEEARNRAYQLDPEGVAGRSALLATAERLLDSDRLSEADTLFSRLAVDEVQDVIEARARLGRVRAGLGFGRFGEARAQIRRVAKLRESAEVQEAVPDRLFKWISEVAELLPANRIVDSPPGAYMTCPPEAGRAPLLLYWEPATKAEEAARLQGATTIKVRALRFSGGRMELGDNGTVDVTGLPRQVVACRSEGDELRGVVTEIKTAAAHFRKIFWFQLSSGRLRPRELPGSEMPTNYSVVDAADVDGNGTLDLLIKCPIDRRRGLSAHYGILLDGGTELIPVTRCVGNTNRHYFGCFADLDGDGLKNEVVCGLGGWSHFSLSCFQYTPAMQAEAAALGFGRFPEPGKHFLEFPVGAVTGHFLRKSSDGSGDELFVAGDRQRRNDISAIFGESLMPSNPDAIWRITMEERRWSLQAIRSIPFKDRHGAAFKHISPLSGVIEGFPQSFLATRYGPGGSRTEVVAEYGVSELPVLWIPVGVSDATASPTRSSAAADLDGDGRIDLWGRIERSITQGDRVIGQRPVFLVFGLKADRDKTSEVSGESSTKLNRTLDSNDLLEVPLNLIVAGRYAAGRRQLEAILAEQALTATVRIQALMLLADSFAREASTLVKQGKVKVGRRALLSAREACRRVVLEFPRRALEAALLGAEFAELAEDHAQARADLVEIRRIFRLTLLQKRQVTRRLARLRPLLEFKERLALTAAGITGRAEPAGEVLGVMNPRARRPWLMSFESAEGGLSDALAVSISGLSQPAMSSDFEWNGDPLRVIWTVRVPRLDFAGRCALVLAPLGDNSSRPLSVHIHSGGGGDEDSYQRSMQIVYGRSYGDRYGIRKIGGPELDAFRPGETFTIDLFYRPSLRSVRVRITSEAKDHGERAVDYLGELALQTLPGPGRWRLAFGVGPEVGYTPHRQAVAGQVRLEVVSAVVLGGAATVRAVEGDSRDALERAGASFLQRDWPACLEAIKAAGPELRERPRQLAELAMLRAFALHRSGRSAEGRTAFAEIVKVLRGEAKGLPAWPDVDAAALREPLRALYAEAGPVLARRERELLTEVLLDGPQASINPLMSDFQKAQLFGGNLLVLSGLMKTGQINPLELAQLETMVGDPGRVVPILTPLARRPDQVGQAAKLALARAAYRLGRFAEAVDYFEQLGYPEQIRKHREWLEAERKRLGQPSFFRVSGGLPDVAIYRRSMRYK